MASLAVVSLTGGAAGATSPSLAAWMQANGSANGCTTGCPSSPGDRSASVTSFDQATGEVMLFGGLDDSGEGNLNDTWAWNGTTWTQAADAGDAGCTDTCTDAPPPRAASSMAYDPASGQLILFGGGQGAGSYMNDTWAWNGSTWTQVDDATDPACTDTCTGSPSARTGAVMAFDPTLGKLVLFGGITGTNDTWTWDGSGWTQVADASDPGCTTACTGSPPIERRRGHGL